MPDPIPEQRVRQQIDSQLAACGWVIQDYKALGKRYVAAGKVGVALIHFSTKSVAALAAIPLPPLAEQTRIVAEVERRLCVVEGLETVVSANLQSATRLNQSILQKAFTGNL